MIHRTISVKKKSKKKKKFVAQLCQRDINTRSSRRDVNKNEMKFMKHEIFMRMIENEQLQIFVLNVISLKI